jgi:hypothetical protein
VFDYALNIQYRNRVDAGKRLVEQDEQRVCCEGAGNLDAPPLAAGEADAKARAYVPDVEFVEQLFEFLLATGTIEIAAVFQDCEDVLLDGQLAKYRGFLRQVTETHAGAPVHGQRGQVVAIQ